MTHSYTVQPGDSLSSIAAKLGIGNWADLYWWNRAQIKDPNVITTGQVLTVWRWRPPYASWEPYVTTQADDAIPKPPPPVALASAVQQPSQPSAQADPPAQQPAQQPAAQPQGQVGTAGMGGFESCVITRESGGNPDIWNASGHWGLFQFSESTWYAAGAAPGTFGNASAVYQEQIFNNAYSMWGVQPWQPSDGC